LRESRTALEHPGNARIFVQFGPMNAEWHELECSRADRLALSSGTISRRPVLDHDDSMGHDALVMQPLTMGLPTSGRVLRIAIPLEAWSEFALEASNP
jgi:hypothetical protein